MANTKKYVSLAKLGLYDEKIKKYLADADKNVLDESKSYADSLAENYEPSGAVATAQTALQKNIDAAQAAADAADAKAVAAQGEVDALELVVGTLPEGSASVIEYVNKKTEGIATDAALTELSGKVTATEEAIDAIEADYLKGADKQELSDAIAAEATAARAAEKANSDAIAAVVADYLKGADKTELQGGIDTNAQAIAAIKEDVDAFFADADMTESAKDTLKELQEYIASDETGASAMAASIKANSDAIDAVEGRLDTVESKVGTLEDEMDDAQAAIAALQSAVGEDGSVEDMIAAAVAAETQARETAIAGVQETANKGVSDAAAALAAANAASAHADELNTAAVARIATLETASATHALKSEVEAVAGRVTTVEGKVSTLETEMDTVEAKAAANETAIAANVTAIGKKADATALDSAVTRITAIETWHADFVEVSEEEINGLFSQNA